MAKDAKGSVRRRRFLLGGAATLGVGAAGVAAWQLHKHRPVEDARVRVDPERDRGFYRRLGRTDLRVAAVSIGAGSIDRPGIVARAVDSGLNYIDTAICYGDSELVVGRALAENPGLRDKLIIATKWDPKPNTPKAKMLESLDKSLQRLGTDYVDVLQVHWLGGGHVRPDSGEDRLDNPALYEAMEEAKKSGKARFFGATSHDQHRGRILQHAIDKGAFDMILVKMNHLDFEDAGIPALLAKARDNDVGVVAMKTQPDGGSIPVGFEDQRFDAYQANLRWALSQPVATVVESGIGTDEQKQDLAIEAAKTDLTPTDIELLERYGRALSPSYCRGCDDVCGPSCPDGVAIGAVLQFEMYDRSYGWTARARRHFAALPPAAQPTARCLECEACSDACPFGVDASARVRRAAARLADGGGSRA
jgi:predicted aldo/keto reductase-like oxidoreductase